MKYLEKNIIGHKFGRLLVNNIIRQNNKRMCECECECGKKIVVNLSHIGNGSTKSCGCYKIDCNKENARKIGQRNRKEMYCRVCGKIHYAKGLCKACYERERRIKKGIE